VPFGFGRSKGSPAPDARPDVVPERLGEITVPSGDLILIDFGLLHIWSGENEPALRPGDAADNVIESANSSVDISIDGPDALRAAAKFDLAAGRGTYFFDQQPDYAAELVAKVATEAHISRLDATASVLNRRLPHAERLRRLLDETPYGVEVPFHGVWAVAVRGLPRDTSLPVYGRRMPVGSRHFDRWASVWVECAAGDVAASHEVGYVLVDEARLMWSDAYVLPTFRIGVQPDDLVDVVLWGRDASEMAARLSAKPIDEAGRTIHGWLDLSLEDARSRLDELERIKADEGLLFNADARPHNDAWRLLHQARSAATESATVRLEGGAVCGFFTSWGDGAFPVYRDVDATNRLLRVRVELGAFQIVAAADRLEERWFGEFSKLALVSARIARDGEPARWLYREAPDHDNDSGWRIFAGDESQDYNDDARNIEVIPLRDLLKHDADLEDVFRVDAPCQFERSSSGELVRVERQ
jgi:hypothetical protein